MPESKIPTTRRLRLRYPDECAVCGIELSRGAEAIWNRETKAATCLACAPAEGAPQSGTAGLSAASEGARRRDKRIEEVRRKHGDHAAAVAEQMAERDNAASWGKGSQGESRLAAFVAREVGDSVIALHDRLIPGTRGNIDHIFVASSGVWVVDAKSYKGKVEQREHGPIWRRESEVYVGRRNRTALTKSVEKQVAAVKAALERDPELKSTHVYGSLCFLDSDWGGLFDSPFSVGAVWIAYPRALKKNLKKSGPLSREKMERIARRLDMSLPRATS
jgi:hypothetical protein